MRHWHCAVAAALIAGCNPPPPANPAPPPKVEGESVVFPVGSPQLAALPTAPVEARREAVLRFNGRIVWDEDRTVRVFSPFGGRVLKIAVRLGERVRPGQALALIAAPELGSAQADARKAEQDDALARKTLARVEELVGAGVAPAKDLQAAQADAGRAAAERARTAERLRLYGKTSDVVDQRFALSSPIAGTVVERNLNPGQELRPDAQGERGLFVVSDPRHLWFVLDVAEGDVGAVHAGDEVRLQATMLGEDSVPGTITHVADFVDPQTRTVKVRGSLDNADGRLKAETFVTASLTVPAANGVVVPTGAVYLRGEKHYVFIADGAARFTRRVVRLGPTQGARQVVLEGLAPGDRVVTDGNLLLERLLASRD
ncbi:MAG TPA: efflux RND transporter periplasmic adaptor subunit [Burkholderiales bacterium]|nr:efflux RND transporter periplasmic adaptor subunit [Burkholderiales bacterium]